MPSWKKGPSFTLLVSLILSVVVAAGASQTGGDKPNAKRIESGARVFVAPIEGGFDVYLVAALVKKQVPLTVVNDRRKADYEISGISDTEKAGWAKMLFSGSDQTNEQASIKVVEIKTGEVVFGYNVHKGNSYKGKQSAAEACAKHIKENITGK